MDVTLPDIVAARARIAGGVQLSPCVESVPLSELCGARIHCKLDHMQRTGSFKERGARNALLTLPPDRRGRGVISASAGNHALGMAYHGGLLGIPVTVVMPRTAPLIKVATCRRLGARVVVHGDDLAAARARADDMVASEGLTYVHGYNDAAIIAGQGTMALEILEQVPDVEAVIVPVGGGGLIAGVSLAIKSLRPDVRVIGVEPDNAACYQAALAAGAPVAIEVRPTLADGLAVAQIGGRSFDIAHRFVDELVTVSEADLALAVLRLAELEKSVVEGAGAASLAALLAGRLPDLRGRKVVLCVSGGNIDLNILGRVLEFGLVEDGRLCRFTAVVSDRPGGLSRVTGLIAQAGASVKEVWHDRAFSGPDVSQVRVVFLLETNSKEHGDEVLQALRDAGVRLD